jgi:uncharacterized protein YbjT (DUF2867 family)
MGERVFVTGGSGFVGSAILQELSRRNIPATALVNRRNLPAAGGDVVSFKGDIFDPGSLAEGLKDCRAVIHLVGIIFEKPGEGITFERMHVESTRNVVETVKRAGIRRLIHMSALGVRPEAVSDYHKTKWRGEEIVRGSGLEWTIFRPSMIHGPAGEFMKMEAKWARKQSPPFLFMPYFGAGIFGTGGAGLVQPVYVRDVARGFVDALGNGKSISRAHPLAGKARLSWPQMHRLASRAIVGKPRLALGIPAWYGRLLTSVVPRGLLPFNRDQIVMSQEDNTADMAEFISDFGWEPGDFASTLQEYVDKL